MNILNAVTNAFGGDIFGKVIDVVKAYFPPSMSEAEKTQAELAMVKVKSELEGKLNDTMQQIQAGYEQRIRDLEGTAADLKTIPIIGNVVIFFRGMQRPLWGYAVLFLDYQVFAGEWVIVEGSRYDTCFLIINLLVLGFLFGERAIQNVAPLIERLVAVKK